jgi:hypothetical protein
MRARRCGHGNYPAETRVQHSRIAGRGDVMPRTGDHSADEIFRAGVSFVVFIDAENRRPVDEIRIFEEVRSSAPRRVDES